MNDEVKPISEGISMSDPQREPNNFRFFFKSANIKIAQTFSMSPAVSPYFLSLLMAAIFVYTFYPLFKEYHPSRDYLLVSYFAEVVSKGGNPYSIPGDYQSSIVPTFSKAGWIQGDPYAIVKQLADSPPLLMVVNSLFFRLHNLKGLYWAHIFLYASSIALYIVYAISRKSEGCVHEPYPLLFLMFFALNPLFSRIWFTNIIVDKAWFPFLILMTLVFRNKPYWVAASLGIFAALKGLGTPIMFFYCLHLVSHKGLPHPKRILYLILIFTVILALSHLPWFPECLKAYQGRVARQTWVGHYSMFVPFNVRGIYWNGIPKVLTALTFLLFAFLTVKRFVTLDEVLLLPVVFSIIFNTELPVDRLLVAIFALVLASRHNRIVVTSYFMGLLLVASPDVRLSWVIVWVWALFLMFETGREFFIRVRRRTNANSSALVSSSGFSSS